MAIRKADWQRMRRDLKRCSESSTSRFTVLASLFFGASASLLITVPTLILGGAAGWVVASYAVATVGTALAGVAFWMAASATEKRQRDDIARIEDDMQQLEALYASS